MPAADDPLETILCSLLDLPLPERAAALEKQCDAIPGDEAQELRARFALLDGMLSIPTATAAADLETFGNYRRLRLLGSGGMGVVYLAEQTHGDAAREVALKLIRFGALFSAEARERFRREARAAIRLDHPGICPVYDVGEVDGTPYLAMRYVPGRTLSTLIREARDQRTQLLFESYDSATGSAAPSARRSWIGVTTMIEKLARALQAAHEVGLVHRDIKPGNIMVQPDGDPVLLDFGLVHDLTSEEATLTGSEQSLGTPAYMPPERIRGTAPVARSGDVYSLGATLFECLTLTPPFEAPTRDALYHKILNHPVPDPRRLDPRLPKDLSVILATAMHPLPHRRYATAAAVADDLRRLVELQPIQARRASLAERAGLWVRRNPMAATALAALLLGLCSSMVFWRDAIRARDEALRGFRFARDAMRTMTDTADRSLAKVPEFLRARRAIHAEALAFHDRMIADYGTLPEVQLDVSEARLHRAQCMIQLDQYEQATTELQQLIGELAASSSPRHDQLRAEALKEQARMTTLTSRHADGLVAGRAALALYQRIGAETIDARFALSQAHRVLAACLIGSGAQLEGLKSAGEAIQLLRHNDTDPRSQRALFYALVSAGQTQLGLGARDDARTSLQEAHQLSAAVMEGRSVLDADELAEFYLIHGRALEPDLKAAAAAYQRTFDLTTRWIERYAELSSLRARRGWALYHLSETARRQGDKNLASQRLEKALNSFQGLCRTYPDDLGYRLSLQKLRINQANRDPNHEAAQSVYADVAAVLSALAPPQRTRSWRETLAKAHAACGNRAHRRRLLESAESSFRAALALRLELLQQTDAPGPRRVVALTEGNLGIVAMAGRRRADAQEWFQRALANHRLAVEQSGAADDEAAWAMAWVQWIQSHRPIQMAHLLQLESALRSLKPSNRQRLGQRQRLAGFLANLLRILGNRHGQDQNWPQALAAFELGQAFAPDESRLQAAITDARARQESASRR